MVSLLQDQASIKFPSSDTLNSDHQDDLMQMQGDSSPPEQQAVSKTCLFLSISKKHKPDRKLSSCCVRFLLSPSKATGSEIRLIEVGTKRVGTLTWTRSNTWHDISIRLSHPGGCLWTGK